MAQQGFSQQDIEEGIKKAFSANKQKSTINKLATGHYNYFTKLLSIFFRPLKILSNLKYEEGLSKPIEFVIITSIIIASISIIFGLMQNSLYNYSQILLTIS
ncbi:MAG: hypothetical protein AABX78_01790, partial [Nanoarchaeota archaeon]